MARIFLIGQLTYHRTYLSRVFRVVVREVRGLGFSEPLSPGFLGDSEHGTDANPNSREIFYVNLGGGLGIFGIGVVFQEMSVDQLSKMDRWLRQLAGRRIQRQSIGE